MATKEKKVPVLNVGYSDKEAIIRVTDPKDDSEVDSLDVRKVMGEAANAIAFPIGIRYLAGSLRDAIAAAEKAKADAVAAVRKAIKAIMDGTIQFRERGGEGGLSTEQEFAIIAGVFVALGITKTAEEALPLIQAKYDVTKEVVTPAKGTPGTEDYREEKRSLTRPEYRKLKAVADVAAALAKAQKVDSVSELADLGITKAA